MNTYDHLDWIQEKLATTQKHLATVTKERDALRSRMEFLSRYIKLCPVDEEFPDGGLYMWTVFDSSLERALGRCKASDQTLGEAIDAAKGGAE